MKRIERILFQNLAAPLALSIGAFFILTAVNLLLIREREKESEAQLFQVYSEALASEFSNYFLSESGVTEQESRERPSAGLLMASLRENIRSTLAGQSEKQSDEWHLLSFVLGAVAVGAMTFFLAGKASRHFSTPLRQLTEMVKRFGKGDFTTAVDLSGKEREFRELADAFRIMNDKTAEAIDRIAVESSARAAAEQELVDARKIRESLLPDEVADVPDFLQIGIRPQTMNLPGQIYDYCRLTPDVWAVMTGEVTGDWGDASLKLAVLSALFEHAALRATNEDDFLRRLQDEWENDPVLGPTVMKLILLLCRRDGTAVQLAYAKPHGVEERFPLLPVNFDQHVVHLGFGRFATADTGILTIQWREKSEDAQ